MKKKCVVYRRGWGSDENDTFNEKYWTGGFTPKGNPQETSLVYQAAEFEDIRHGYRVAGRYKTMSRWRCGIQRY